MYIGYTRAKLTRTKDFASNKFLLGSSPISSISAGKVKPNHASIQPTLARQWAHFMPVPLNS